MKPGFVKPKDVCNSSNFSKGCVVFVFEIQSRIGLAFLRRVLILSIYFELFLAFTHGNFKEIKVDGAIQYYYQFLNYCNY